jgi:hypothetical protein
MQCRHANVIFYFFVVYLTMLSVFRTVWRRKGGMIGKVTYLGGMWAEAVVA